MKTTLYDNKGAKKSQIDLPKVFTTRIREDIVKKYFEADKMIQPYMPSKMAGLRQSAAGIISHKRHDWKGHYGRGISRVPRKIMWRRGTQFMWVGATAPGTKGGRRSHPPKGIGKEKKMNKKEVQIALDSAIAATAHKDLFLKRYTSISKTHDLPLVIEHLPTKTKELRHALTSMLGESAHLALKSKEIRAGKGKLRGRKYKSNAGILIIVDKDEKKNFSGVEIKTMQEATIKDFYPLGRLTLFTHKALNALDKKHEEKKQ
jgi:large subunit ribosomal protein L4e